VALERGLRIIDSPGVVFDDAASPSSLLRNVLKPEVIPDPQAVIEEILSRTSIETLQTIYKLPPDSPFRDAAEFLTMVALTTGRLGSGGVPDLAAAATQVMRDWNNSKIPYYTEPPAIHPSQMPSAAPGAENVGEMKVVNAWKPAFDLGDLYGGADRVTLDDGMQEDEEFMEQDHLLPIAGQKRPHTPDPDTASEGGINPPVSVTSSSVRLPKPKRTKKEALSYDVEMDAQMEGSNPFSRKSLKKGAKRMRKEAGRRERERKVSMRVDAQEDGDGNDLGSPFTFRASVDGRISI
jgi:nuclear GTP-binding protein